MNDYSPSPLRLRADSLVAGGRPAEAALLYRRLAEENPDDDSNLLSLAWALNDCGKKEEAIGIFENLFSRELERGLIAGFALDELVRIYREDENREALLSVCRRAAKAQPDDAGILQTVGTAFLHAGVPSEAVVLFEKLTEVHPDAPELWEALGEALIAVGSIDRADAAYRKAAETDPPASTIYLDHLACTLMQAGYSGNAVDVWRECEDRQTGNPAYALSAGEGLVSMEKFDDAFAAFGRAAALRGSDAGEYWRRLGDLLTKRDEPARAEQSFERAVRANPQNLRYRLKLASCLTSQGKNDQASAILEQVKKLTGNAFP